MLQYRIQKYVRTTYIRKNIIRMQSHELASELSSEAKLGKWNNMKAVARQVNSLEPLTIAVVAYLIPPLFEDLVPLSILRLLHPPQEDLQAMDIGGGKGVFIGLNLGNISGLRPGFGLSHSCQSMNVCMYSTIYQMIQLSSSHLIYCIFTVSMYVCMYV